MFKQWLSNVREIYNIEDIDTADLSNNSAAMRKELKKGQKKRRAQSIKYKHCW